MYQSLSLYLVSSASLSSLIHLSYVTPSLFSQLPRYHLVGSYCGKDVPVRGVNSGGCTRAVLMFVGGGRGDMGIAGASLSGMCGFRVRVRGCG